MKFIFISTTVLAKSEGIPVKALFERFCKLGYVAKDGDQWVLTDKGKEYGGEYRNSQYGKKYIAWKQEPSVAEKGEEYNGKKRLSATAIGKTFDLSAKKINLILSELGWIQREQNGWMLTEHGKNQGGTQLENNKYAGTGHIVWKPEIIQSKILKEAIGVAEGVENAENTAPAADNKIKESHFREKFPAKLRATDGHFVRSKAEMLIDNWLYMEEIAHAYERKLPVEEDVYSDFYIPSGKVYIEYWGYENDPKYLARKKKKIEIYKKYNFNLIELQDTEVQNLDDTLPQLLIKYGVKIY